MFQGPAEIGQDAIFGGTKVAINGVVHLYSSLPEREQSFARKCLRYRDKRIGNPEDPKNRLGEIFRGHTPAKLPLASFTAIHIFSAECFEENAIYELGRLWDNEALLDELNSWEPPANWRHVWRLERRFNSDGLLLFHDKLDYSQQYIQFTERGIIEAVDHGVHSWALHKRTIPGNNWENGILKVLPPLLRALRLIGGNPPAIICLSMRDSLEYMTVSYDPEAINKDRDDATNRHRMGIKEEILTMPPAVLNDFGQDLTTLMKPCFDTLARAGGWPGSPRYRKRPT